MTLIYSTRSTWRLPLLGLLVWLTALIACSHDSKRDNPLDPELTPAVELQVALDDSAGTATLTWTPYDGETSFTMYWVLRKVPGLETVDTLAAINDVQVTSHEDDTLRPNTSYSYRVSVVNTSGFEFSSEEQTVEGYSGSSVTLFEHEVDSGEVILRWSRFSGGRFEAYRIERFSLDVLDFEEIGRITNVGDTLFTDPDPVPEISRYRIVVEAAGETFVSNRSDKVRLSDPAVVLQSVEIDKQDGTATLTWSQYAGEQTFVSYEIRRRTSGESTPETLDSITDVSTTSFVDTGLLSDRRYIYSVVVRISTSGTELPADVGEAFFAQEPPQVEITIDHESASAELTWTRAVAGFENYQVRRRVADGDVTTLWGDTANLRGTNFDIDDTTYVDVGLAENEEYVYSVTTVSATGALAESTLLFVRGPLRPKIAFYSRRDENWEVYVMNPDGTDPVNLTNHPRADGRVAGVDAVGRPVWSPDGQRIAFVSNRDNSFGDVFVMNADGSDQVNLTNSRSYDVTPSWSPDGNRIAFSSNRGGETEVYVMDADGTNVTQLTDTPGDPPSYRPVWSPDGSHIAFVRQSDETFNPDVVELYVMNADGSNQVNLTPDSEWQHFNADWSPDGTRIVYDRFQWETRLTESEVYVMDADGSNKINLTNSPNTKDAEPDWSPDGSKIAFASDRGEGTDIYVMDADGSNLTRLTGASPDKSPDWRPVWE